MTDPAGDPGVDLDLVTAALRADSADVAIYTQVLTESLGDSLPAGVVVVDRERSMSDRMKGRPGRVARVTVRLGEDVLTLSAGGSGEFSAEICHEVRGVVLSRQPVGVEQWAEKLAQALVVYSQQNAHAAEALRKLVAGP